MVSLFFLSFSSLCTDLSSSGPSIDVGTRQGSRASVQPPSGISSCLIFIFNLTIPDQLAPISTGTHSGAARTLFPDDLISFHDPTLQSVSQTADKPTFDLLKSFHSSG